MDISTEFFCSKYKEQTGKSLDMNSFLHFTYSKVENVKHFISLYEFRLSYFIEASDSRAKNSLEIIDNYKVLIEKLSKFSGSELYMFLLENNDGFLHVFMDMPSGILVAESFAKK